MPMTPEEIQPILVAILHGVPVQRARAHDGYVVRTWYDFNSDTDYATDFENYEWRLKPPEPTRPRSVWIVNEELSKRDKNWRCYKHGGGNDCTEFREVTDDKPERHWEDSYDRLKPKYDAAVDLLDEIWEGDDTDPQTCHKIRVFRDNADFIDDDRAHGQLQDAYEKASANLDTARTILNEVSRNAVMATVHRDRITSFLERGDQ